MPDAPVADVPLRRLWIALAVVVIGSFATLLYYGGEVYQEALNRTGNLGERIS